MAKTIAVLGDSITAAGFVAQSSSIKHLIQGWPTWASLYAGGYSWGMWANYGVGGDTTSDMLARIDEALEDRPDMLMVMGGTNDLGSANVPMSLIANNYFQMSRKAHAAGSQIAFVVPLPRFDLKGERRERREKIREFLNSLKISGHADLVIDVDPIFGRLTEAKEKYWKVDDPIHPNIFGHERIGWAVARALDASGTGLNMPFCDVSDALTTSPFGNLVTNSGLGQEGGTFDGQHTGTIALGLTSRFDSNWTTATATTQLGQALRSGGHQRMAVRGTAPANAGHALHILYFDCATPQAGQTIRFGAEIRAEKVKGASSIYLLLKDQGATTTYYELARGHSSTEQMPQPEDHWLNFVSQPVTIGANPTSLELRVVVRAIANQEVDVEYEVRNPWVRVEP